MASLKTLSDQDLEGSTDEVVAVLLDRLFSIFDMPMRAAEVDEDTGKSDVFMDEWFTALTPYPARVLSRAIDHIIASYKYPSPPKPANVIEYCRIDRSYKLAWSVRARIGQIEGHREAVERNRPRS